VLVYLLGMPLLVRTLILDYGGVLVHPQTPQAMRRLAALARAEPETFSAAYWKHRPDYDLRGRSGDYWRQVLESCGAAADPQAAIDRLVEADARSWMVYIEEVWETAAAFRSAGGRTAMLSNGVRDIVGRVDAERPLALRFDTVVLSGEVGLVKPEPAIYRLCLERLGAEAGSSLFVDDRQENLDGASRVGMQTLLFAGEESIPGLRQRLGLPDCTTVLSSS
jgi:putative hydrolase of the HAD superfamily